MFPREQKGEKVNKIIVNSRDKRNSYEFQKVFIFSSKFTRKITKNNFFFPKACILIIVTNKEIIRFTLLNSFVTSDNSGDIQVLSSHKMSKLIGKKDYFNQEEIKKNKSLLSLYESNSNFGISVAETIEREKLLTIKELLILLKRKINPIIGGGF